MRRHRAIEAHDEPTADELAEIEREWPQIEAELALLDAEIRILTAQGGPSLLDRRRLRRTERQVLATRGRRRTESSPAGPEAA